MQKSRILFSVFLLFAEVFRNVVTGFSSHQLSNAGLLRSTTCSEIPRASCRARCTSGAISFFMAHNHRNARNRVDASKYPPLFLAGGLCAMVTHGLTVPIDLIKTIEQVSCVSLSFQSNTLLL
jgi:hypothetical protein